MDWKLELIAVPVTDVDRAKQFYERVGFVVDHDHAVSDEIRFVQLTPPGSACSIALGKGITPAEPGSVKGMQVVVASAEQARAELADAGIEVERGAGLPMGPVRVLQRPRRQRLGGAGAGRPSGLARVASAP